MKNIQLFVPKFRKQEILENISDCLDKGWTGLGYKTLEIEKEWSKYTGLENCHFLNSSTAGLHLAVKILKDVNKWKTNDEVITTPLTFVSTNHAILYENLKPVFADVDDQLCLSPESILKNITKRTKAVMFVGMGGNTGQLNKVIDICKEHNLKLILDAAHMSGTFYKRDNNVNHICKEADVVIFSFQAVKNLPTADSGMICFKNKDYDDLARKLSWLGIDKDTYTRSNSKGAYKWEYDIIGTGYKYHGNSIMASIALVSLKYLDQDNQRRRDICELYENAFNRANINSIQVHKDCVTPSRHLYQIVVPNRNEFINFLNMNGVYPGVHYRDNTLYSMYNYDFGKCPNSIKLSESVISLPLHMNLTNDDIDFVIHKVIEGYKLMS